MHTRSPLDSTAVLVAQILDRIVWKRREITPDSREVFYDIEYRAPMVTSLNTFLVADLREYFHKIKLASLRVTLRTELELERSKKCQKFSRTFL